MINLLRENTFNCSTPLHYVVAKLFQIYDNKEDGVAESTTEVFKKTRARMLPKPPRNAYVFAPDTVSWLRSCAIETTIVNKAHQSTIYTIPLLGITNRPLAGYKTVGFNLYKTLVKLTIPTNVRNFDQCTIEFSSRMPVNKRQFAEEVFRQINITNSRVKKKGRLTFYSHSYSGIAAMTDLGALRLSALKAMPVINIDWLDASIKWDTLWNPCAKLEPMQSKLEAKLVEFLDKLVSQVCANQCNAVMERSGCFFDNIYMPHRKQNKMPHFNKIAVLPSSILQSDRSVDPFDAECNLLNYLSSNIGSGLSKRPRWIAKVKATEEGWLPVTI